MGRLMQQIRGIVPERRAVGRAQIIGVAKAQMIMAAKANIF